MMIMTNKELSSQIRNEFKAAGYKRNDYSLKVSDAGYSSSIRVKIKNPKICRKDIQQLLNKYESVERDERSGEIMEGANCYVFVDYGEGIFDEVAQEWAADAASIYRSSEETIRIFNGLFFIHDKKTGEKKVFQNNENEYCHLRCDNFLSLCIYIYKFATFGSIRA